MSVSMKYFGETAKMHHIGMVVNRIDQCNLGHVHVYEDPLQKVKVAFVKLGDTYIELIEPIGEDSPVINSLKKGTKLVHICFEVDVIEEALDSAKIYQFKIVQEPTPAVAFSNRKIAWVYHPNWGLYELLERN